MAEEKSSATAQIYVPGEGYVDEDKSPQAHATPVTLSEDGLENGNNPANLAHWQPGFAAQFPWLGIGALAGVALCLLASVLILVISNGKTQTTTWYQRAWPRAVAPNVLISIFNNVSNICFTIAISNGVAIAWWRRALKGGTIRDLNRSWQFSSSVKEIAFSGKAFNIIALTALVAKMTVIDSTLLQKAIGTYTQEDYIGYKNSTAWGYINQTFPSTGMADLSSSASSGLQDWFNSDIQIWQLGGGLFPNQFYVYKTAWGNKTNPITRKELPFEEQVFYNSTSYVNMTGAGLQFDCLDPVTESINASALAFPSQNTTALKDQMLFGIQFTVHHGVAGTVPDGPDAWVKNSDYIVMETTHSTPDQADMGESDLSSCPGALVRQTCRLRAAIVQYPIELSQRGLEASWTARIGTDEDYLEDSADFNHYNPTLKQQNYFSVVQTIDLKDFPYASGGPAGGNSTYSGLASGLQTYLGGYAAISKVDGSSAYTLNQSGSAQSYLTSLPQSGSCNYNFSAPLNGGENLLGYTLDGPKSQFINPGLIGKINSIMFGLATDVANMDPNNDYGNNMQFYRASIWADTIHYSTNFWYMGGAIASSIVCILCVLPSYWGFWQLGRKVTLGPFEIAAAFRAPNLHHERLANAPVERLIEEVGDRQVRFGQIVMGSDRGRIGVAEREFVERVTPKVGGKK